MTPQEKLRIRDAMESELEVRACETCGEAFAETGRNSKKCYPCDSNVPAVQSPYDECYCGDLRNQHGKDGCMFKGSHPGGFRCRQFLLVGREGWRDK